MTEQRRQRILNVDDDDAGRYATSRAPFLFNPFSSKRTRPGWLPKGKEANPTSLRLSSKRQSVWLI